LLVALHGAGSDHRNNLARVFGVRGSADDDAVLADPAFANAPMLVVSPLGRGEVMGYHGLGEDDVLRVLADVRRAYNVDPDRIYLTGLSMGGGGTWHIGLRHPDLFAALVPVCGVVDPRKWIDRRDRELTDDAALSLQLPPGLADNALNQRVFIYHGDADTVVPVSDSRLLVKRFEALGWLGKTVRYVELPGVAHNAWDTAYRDGNVFTLLAGIRRDPFPARVVFKTPSLRYAKAYWLRVDRIDRGGTLAEVAGQRDGQTFTVRTDNVSGFSLLLDAKFVPAAEVVTVHVTAATGAAAGAAIYKGPAQPVLSFVLDRSGWRQVAQPATGAPPEHAPIGLMSRSLPRQRPHLYVYGTAGAREVNDATAALARALADWGPGVRARFAVKADRDVTAEELATRDLVLVGSGRVNLLVRRMAERLPIGDDAAAGDRAYRLIAPNPLAPSRYVLVLGAQSVSALRRLGRFVAPNHDAWGPESNLDYVLFDEAGRVKRSGVFRDDWRLPR
jgi:predicted esterase